MPITAREYISQLPKERQKKIEERAQELLAEELTLQALRKVIEKSQAEVAETLGVKQSAVSKLERRADLRISTLSEYIKSLGGRLEILASFPDRSPVVITELANVDEG